jgi:hypothetical protein
MIAASRLTLALTVSVWTAAVALTGCSSATPAPTAPSSSSAAPSPRTPAPGTGASGSATAAGTSASGSGALTATISGLPAAPVLAFGGQSAKFTVTLRNGSDSTYRDITPLLSIGHCSCNPSPVSLAPAGSLQELDPSTGNWHPVSYLKEGTGTDFLTGPVQQQPVTLAPGATASFTFRLALAPLSDQSSGERAGQTSVDVTVETVPGSTVIGHSDTAVLPVTVTMPAS